MTCGNKPVGPRAHPPAVCLDALEETGRLHFFYHSRDSDLPVRDVLDRHGKGLKKEPYLERSAENYCVPCLQKNICGFLKSNEKYLFLFTRRSDPQGDKNRYVVGYLTKQRCLRRSHLDKGRRVQHWAVQGPIILVSFDEAFPLGRLSGLSESQSVHLRFKKVNEEQTRELLAHFRKRKNIFSKCLREVRKLNKMLINRGRDAGRPYTCRG